MKMVLFTSGIFFLISYAFYNILTISEYFKEIKESELSTDKCLKINSRLPIEDFVKYNDEYLIGASAHYHTLQKFIQKGQINKGTMVSFNLKTNQLQELPINNFPEGVPFFPHGIDLFNKEYIYIINHSFTEQYSERVEVVKIIPSPLSLVYVKSFVLPLSFTGTLNSIGVIEEDNFYFSTYKSSTPLQTGNPIVDYARTVYSKYIRFVQVLFNFKMTHLYNYNRGTIKVVPGTKSLVGNGIAYIPSRRLLYFAQTLEKQIFLFKVSDDKKTINLQKIIKLDYAIDNLFFDPKTEKISVGIIGKVFNYVKYSTQALNKEKVEYDEVYGGLVEIDTKKNDSVVYVNIIKGQLRGISSGFRNNNKVYYVSPEESGILICKA